LERLQRRIEDRDIAANDETFANQLKAIVEYGDSKDDNFVRLKNIQQPTLIVNGNNDTMVSSINSFTMAQHIPDSKLVMWSNSGHGAIFQNHNDFVIEVESFLNK
jgi:pimeloyl-ACP methyl ester carboxylesterase